MTYSRRDVEAPNRPVLVVGLEGWIDPGFAAATAMAGVLEQYDTRTWVAFDSDEYMDLRARRPQVRIHDGVRGRIFWPGPRIRVGKDSRGTGFALLVGPEPDLRWNAFANEVAELAVELQTPLLVGLGAFPVPTPHTRPTQITATASNQPLASQIGFMRGARERPARMIDVLGAYCDKLGIPSIGLSARVPHYVGTTAYPAASVALLESLSKVSGLHLDTSTLKSAAESSREQIDELIAQSEEHTSMVRELEHQYDQANMPIMSEAILPSGDELAEELERYLRGDLQ